MSTASTWETAAARPWASQRRLFDASDYDAPAVTWLEPGLADSDLISPDAVDTAGLSWAHATHEEMT